MMKMNRKQFLLHSWEIRAEGRTPLKDNPENDVENTYIGALSIIACALC